MYLKIEKRLLSFFSKMHDISIEVKKVKVNLNKKGLSFSRFIITPFMCHPKRESLKRND